MKLSVVVPCHNYAHYLGDCLRSILGQSRPPDEIIVIDDASSDDPRSVLARFRHLNLSYLRVEYRDVLLARKAGVLAARGEIICCVDADDTLGPGYLEGGLQAFQQHPHVAVVYSDFECFGNQVGKSQFPSDLTRHDMARYNVIHAGALFRKDAALAAGAFDDHLPDCCEDWFVWRKITRQGFRAVKQSGLYNYRRHAGGRSLHQDYGKNGYTYFLCAALAKEAITLCLTLSGRPELWPPFAAFLEQQTWKHRQVRIVLLAAEQGPHLSVDIGSWLARCDYDDVRFIRWRAESTAGDKTGEQVRMYNRLRQEITTDYVWLLGENGLPPFDAAELLLGSFDPQTVWVCTPRWHLSGGPPQGHNAEQQRPTDGCGVEIVRRGCLDCAMVRNSLLRRTVFAGEDIARQLSEQVRPEERIKMDWSLLMRSPVAVRDY